MSKSKPIILLNLQESGNPQAGISQHEMHLARGLAETGRYKLKGVAHRVNISGFPFPVRRSPVPYRYRDIVYHTASNCQLGCCS